jgi:two-component system nitrogen regulation response regulator NtrX
MDLEKACAEGRFRQDLFFRLNVIPIHVPPLRERASDIPLLLYQFLKDLDIEDLRLEQDAIEQLSSHGWPGNVRELKNLAERIAVMHSGDSMDKQALSQLINKAEGKTKATGAVQPGEFNLPGNILEKNFNEAKESFEKRYLEFQLFKNNGIISRTAEAIGIYPSNLHAKLKKYGIAAQTITNVSIQPDNTRG